MAEGSVLTALSPLAAHEAALTVAGSAHLSLRERPPMGQISVRGAGQAFFKAFQNVVGCKVPQTPNTFTSAEGIDVVWCAPDEWLVLEANAAATPARITALRVALLGEHAAVVDVSHNRCGFEISGDAARVLLSRVCMLDVHSRAFQPGQCAQTLFVRASGLLLQKADAPPCYWLFVRNSFAAYLAAFLLDAVQGVHAGKG